MTERLRDRRVRRQFSAHQRMLLAGAVVPSRDRALRRMGISLDDLASLFGGEVSGAALDRRVAEQRRSRAAAVAVCKITPAAEARAAEKRRIYSQARADAALAAILDEQARDERVGHRVPKRPWLVSMDAPIFDGDDDSMHDRGEGAYFVRRRGDFLTEAPWVEPLIERIDATRTSRPRSSPSAPAGAANSRGVKCLL